MGSEMCIRDRGIYIKKSFPPKLLINIYFFNIRKKFPTRKVGSVNNLMEINTKLHFPNILKQIPLKKVGLLKRPIDTYLSNIEWFVVVD